MRTPTYTPEKYIVVATFKPDGVQISNASETRTVTFEVEPDTSRGRINEQAKRQIVKQNILDADILDQYWELYDIDITAPNVPPEQQDFI